MRLDLRRPVEAEPVDGLALDHLVDEIGGLDTPALRDVEALNLNLFRQNVVPDLLARFANIRPLKHGETSGDLLSRTCTRRRLRRLRSSQRLRHGSVDTSLPELPARMRMSRILTHVAGRSAGFVRVLWVPHPRDPEVCHPHIPVVFEHEILGLNVPMDDVLVMDVLKCLEDASHEEL